MRLLTDPIKRVPPHFSAFSVTQAPHSVCLWDFYHLFSGPASENVGISAMRKMRTESQNPVIKKGIYCIMRNVTKFGKFWMNKSDVRLRT